MTQVNCPVCAGDGLVGAGDQPHLKLGPVSTCPNCAGTGKVEDGQVAEAAIEATPAVEEARVAEAQTPSSGDDVAPEGSSEAVAGATPVAMQPESVGSEGQVPTDVEPAVPVDNVETPVAVEGATLDVASESAQ